MDTEDVGLQVALLGGAIGAVPALEWLPSWLRKKECRQKKEILIPRVVVSPLQGLK